MFAALLCSAALAGPPELDQTWGLSQGLMAGVVVMHGVQPLAVATGDLEWKDKYAVSIAGTALYSVALGGMLARRRWAPIIAIVGPAVGLSTVLTGWGLSRAGVIDADIRPDTFQLAGGALQLPAAVLSVQLLRQTRPRRAAPPEE